MTQLFGHPEGATPLDASEAEFLIPTWIASRRELDAEEAQGIARTVLWADSQSWTVGDFDQAMLKDLHRRMFKDVWKWAGQYRNVMTSPGVDWYRIPTEIEELLRDLREQTRQPGQLPWPVTELAVRFHYRLVVIHPFRNGNGRHARLSSDLVLAALGEPPLSWGVGNSLSNEGPARKRYLDALHDADATGSFAKLVSFAVS